MESHVAGIETADYEIAEVTHDVDSLTELFRGASVVCNTVGPFSRFGPEVVEACLAAGRPLPRHHRRAGLDDRLRREVRRRLRRRRPAARPRRRADVHDRRDRGRALPGEARARHPRHRRVLGRQPDHRLDPDDPVQRRPVRCPLPRAERLRAVRPRGGPLLAGDPGAARARAGAALGRHLAPGLVPAGPAGGQRQGARRGVQPGPDAGRPADRGRGHRGDRRTWRTRRSSPPSRPRPPR